MTFQIMTTDWWFLVSPTVSTSTMTSTLWVKTDQMSNRCPTVGNNVKLRRCSDDHLALHLEMLHQVNFGRMQQDTSEGWMLSCCRGMTRSLPSSRRSDHSVLLGLEFPSGRYSPGTVGVILGCVVPTTSLSVVNTIPSGDVIELFL
jgi:hypothetical protein